LRNSISLDSRANDSIATARAFATYSLVPYLGILFCPGAIVLASIGLIRSHRNQESVNRSSAGSTFIIGILLFAVQIFLWWILYKAPEWARGF
jgi:hypothetical protein